MDWSSSGGIASKESRQVEPIQEANRRIVIVATVAGFSIFVAIGALASFMLGLIGS